MNMCWCKDCKHICEEGCRNGLSENFMDRVGDYNSCKHSEPKEGVATKQYKKGFEDGFKDAILTF